jgi:antitoxin CptB
VSLSKLRWRARRGMKELDVVLNRWLDRNGESATPEQLALFERLLEAEDSELWPWVLGRSAPEDGALKALVDDLRAAD